MITIIQSLNAMVTQFTQFIFAVFITTAPDLETDEFGVPTQRNQYFT